MIGAVLRLVETSAPLSATAELCQRLTQWNKRTGEPLHPDQWDILSISEAGAPHWTAGIRGLDEVEARRRWSRGWNRTVVVGSVQALVRAKPPAPALDPSAETWPAVGPAPAQLELAHFAPDVFSHARLCVDCGGPVELYPCRDGRPRKACERCRPPRWPRRGERWFVDAVPVVVLGSRMARPDPAAPCARRIRVRELETGRRRIFTSTDWRQRAARSPQPAAGPACAAATESHGAEEGSR